MVDMGDAGKPVMMVAVDDSSHSYYALEWTLDHLMAPFGPNHPFKLILVHARSSGTYFNGFVGSASATVASMMEVDAKKTEQKVIDKATELCKEKSVNDVLAVAIEGDARDVLPEAVEKQNATMLVLGSHGYGVLKRAVLGSVSDYCAHHCNCTVMIVNMPKSTN